MRRTGSEEIGSSKALGRAGMIPGLPRVLLLVIFLVELQSGGLGSQNTTMPGALCPASSSLLCFIGWSYPQIVLYSHFIKHQWSPRSLQTASVFPCYAKWCKTRDDFPFDRFQGRTFRISVPKFGSWVGYYRILAHQRSRFNRYYFYIRDEVLGPIVLRVASFFPFSRHLLAQRPLLHRAGTESQPYLLQKGTQPDEPVPFLGHGAG